MPVVFTAWCIFHLQLVSGLHVECKRVLGVPYSGRFYRKQIRSCLLKVVYFSLFFLRTQTRPASEFVSGEESLRPHRVRLHGRPELCNRSWPPLRCRGGMLGHRGCLTRLHLRASCAVWQPPFVNNVCPLSFNNLPVSGSGSGGRSSSWPACWYLDFLIYVHTITVEFEHTSALGEKLLESPVVLRAADDHVPIF